LDAAFERLEKLCGLPFVEKVRAALLGNSDPLQAIIGLERWLAVTGSPLTYISQFELYPGELALLLTVLGASRPLADSLVQNPEFGSLFLDPEEIQRRPSAQQIVEEGQRLLSSSTSPSHSLDRIRYLKQRHTLALCANDLSGTWPQEEVWEALSTLADAIVELTLGVLWQQFAQESGVLSDPAVAVVGFGKLGARELNYSSDIDLAYVLKDGVDEKTERLCVKFCAAFGRALADRMGRGALYRVDLRLRPYGSQGPILAKAGAFRNYYDLYAKTWEIQALIKSRVVVGEWLEPIWMEMRERKAFGGSLSDASLAEVLETRTKIEQSSGEDDLKRGSGGIRDVEFLCQTLQLIYSPGRPELRPSATCDALRALGNLHLIEGSVAAIFVEGYTFLRKLEHRIQLLGDRQTHEIPRDDAARNKLARLMGLESTVELFTAIDLRRKSIRSLYRTILKQGEQGSGSSQRLAARFGPDAPVFLQWFEALPEPESFYASLEANEDAIRQAEKIIRFAPRLLHRFKSNLSMTEALISGELSEIAEDSNRWVTLPLDAPERYVADAYANSVAAAQATWVLDPKIDLPRKLESITDALLRYCLSRFDASWDLIALGSYGSGQMSGCSDIDILLLVQTNQPAAERSAQAVLGFLVQLRRYGFEPKVDLRLRPDGKKGLLVRTFDGFGAYEAGDMEMWERFALGSARLVSGSPEAADLVRRAAYALALTPARFSELAAMKGRMESERLKPQYVNRDVKLGHGGLTDLEWTVHLLEMSYPHPLGAGALVRIEDRIRNLGRAGLLNAFEVESLLDARVHLLELRNRIYLLEYSPDVMPENPQRLDRLAQAFRLQDGNELLRVHEPIVAWVRGLLLESLSRLKR
jgi:glutamate-ammonia-ligase adenylyltransferase